MRRFKSEQNAEEQHEALWHCTVVWLCLSLQRSPWLSVNCLFLTLFERVYVMLLSDGYFQVLLVSAHSALSIPAGPLCTIEAIMIYISIHLCGTINVRNQTGIIYHICVGQNPIQEQMKKSNTHSTRRIVKDNKDTSRILNTSWVTQYSDMFQANV